jgi:hypothetical protein
MFTYWKLFSPSLFRYTHLQLGHNVWGRHLVSQVWEIAVLDETYIDIT